jgi:uncharacterized membrane protein YcaP (DUF421 family)
MQQIVDIFALTKPISEIMLRGTAGFLALVILVRLIHKRNAGHVSPNDMLVLIVIGAMGADAIMGGSHSVGDILMMIAIVLIWAYVLDLLEDRVPLVRRLMRHKHTHLIENGKLLRRNMRQEMITQDEIEAVLRREGVEDFSHVKLATLEADGDISVVKKENESQGTGDPRQVGALGQQHATGR